MMKSIKKAALKISGLSRSDRKWILERLSAQERDTLNSALAELQSLQGNVRIDFDDIVALENERHLSERCTFEVYSDSRIHEALESVSDAFLASLLLSREAATKDRFLKLLPPKRKQSIKEMISLRQSAPAPMASRSLEQYMIDCLRDAS